MLRASPACQVVEGEGRMLVMAVGKRTEWGRLIALTTGETENTPLQDKLTIVASLVAKVGLSVAIACFLVLFIFLCAEVSLSCSSKGWNGLSTSCSVALSIPLDVRLADPRLSNHWQTLDGGA